MDAACAVITFHADYGEITEHAASITAPLFYSSWRYLFFNISILKSSHTNFMLTCVHFHKKFSETSMTQGKQFEPH